MPREHIVLVGTVHDGFVAFGPFKTKGVATMFVNQTRRRNDTLTFHTVPLVEPVLKSTHETAKQAA